MRGRYVSGQAGRFEMPPELREELRGRERVETQELWNLSSRLLTWLTGTQEDNDFETVGKPSQHFGFVSLRVESGHAVKRGAIADEVLELLSEQQNDALRTAVREETARFTAFLETRSLLCRELERAIVGHEVRPARIASLGGAMGRIEGEMTWGQATAILAVRNLLTNEQAEALLAMRKKYVPDEGEAETAPVSDAKADTEIESLAAAQIARGRQLFAQCALCHVTPEGGRSPGPSLSGILGRDIASDPNYLMYSPAMREYARDEGSWTEARLERYLESPRTVVPGTIMGFDGMPKGLDRAALIAYLKTLSADEGASEAESKETAQGPDSTSRPNIVLLVADDQDWAGLSVRMDPEEPGSASSFVQTPRIEQWAESGVRFTRGYSPSPVCSPSRASIQTGMSPGALHWTKAAPSVNDRDLEPPKSERNLNTDYLTIGEVLRDAGYTTAHFGKWHLEGDGPENHGFDESDGATGNQDAIPHKDPNPVDIFGMTERAESFIRTAVKDSKPFFLQMSYHALHHPENAMAETIEKYRTLNPRASEKLIQRAALAENLDDGVGRLLDLLAELDLMGETYIFYTSDNGGGGSGRGALLNGGKGGLGEGGIRVPFIASGPGIQPGGVIHTPVVGFDLYPTFAAIAGAAEHLPDALEGGDILPLFRGESDRVRRSFDGIVFHFPHYQGRSTPQSALLRGSWKLVFDYETGGSKLYNLDDDPGEHRDVSMQNADLAASMLGELRTQLNAIGAILPSAKGEITGGDANPAEQSRARRRRP